MKQLILDWNQIKQIIIIHLVRHFSCLLPYILRLPEKVRIQVYLLVIWHCFNNALCLQLIRPNLLSVVGRTIRIIWTDSMGHGPNKERPVTTLGPYTSIERMPYHITRVIVQDLKIHVIILMINTFQQAK